MLDFKFQNVPLCLRLPHGSHVVQSPAGPWTNVPSVNQKVGKRVDWCFHPMVLMSALSNIIWIKKVKKFNLKIKKNYTILKSLRNKMKSIFTE